MRRVGWAAVAVILVAGPCLATESVGAFLYALGKKLPAELTLMTTPLPGPKESAKLAMPSLTSVELNLSDGKHDLIQTVSFKSEQGSDFEAAFTIQQVTIPCRGRMKDSNTAIVRCWMPNQFAMRDTRTPIIAITLANPSAGPSWSSVQERQTVTYATVPLKPSPTTAQPKPVAAPSAPGEPTQERFDATLGMFANLYSNLGPEYLGGRAGVSTVGGKTALSVINLFKAGRMNFDIERQVYGLKPEDSQDRWSFRFVANDKAKLGGFVWRTQYSKPLDSSFAAVTMLCASNIKDAVHHIDCWDQNLVELFGRDTKNVSVAFELKTAPPFQLDILPGIRNVFTTTGHPDAKASRPN